MIFVIGPDGAGKSHLLKQFPFNVLPQHHFSGATVFAHDLHKLLNASANTAFDRCFLDEQVYGPVFRDHDGLGIVHRRMLERVAMYHSAVVVLLLPPFSVVNQRWRQRGDELVQDVSQLHDIYKGYNNIKTYLPLVINREEFPDPSVIFEQAMEVATPQNLGPGAGRFEKGVTLLVGEQAKDPVIQGNVPFVSSKGCSPWLAQELEDGKVSENALYWINAKTYTGEWTSPVFVEHLKPRAIVALGRTAHQWCQHHARWIPDIDIAYAQHPSSWKRFKHHEPYPLNEIITGEHHAIKV